MWCNLDARPEFIFFLIDQDRAINNAYEKGEFRNPFTVTSAETWRANDFSKDSNVVQLSPELVTYWKDE